ncbi:MAG: PIN domain-containing protein [Acidobacteria bacterium]|nr:PIN domain-containing protein [Acidobacteriota bacterium]
MNPGDPFFTRAREISAEILVRGIEVVTTWEMIVECTALLRYRLGYPQSRKFLSGATSVLTILYPSDKERLAAIEFYLKRSRLRRLSLCDALSYVVVSTRLAWAPCLSFDEDFAAMGLTVVP